MPVHIDQRFVEEAGLSSDTAVTMNVSGVSFRDGLNVLCDNLGLDWMFNNEVILITSPSQAKAKGRIVVYDTSRLMRADSSPDRIAQLVRTLVKGPQAPAMEMGEMMEIGGGGGPSRNRNSGNVFVHRTSLVIRGTEREHHLIQGVLDMLVEHQKLAGEAGENPAALRKTSSRLHASKNSNNIDKALSQDTTLEFLDSPISEVLEFLQDLHKIQFQLDYRSLEEDGLGGDTTVNQNLVGISLNSGLSLMLNELELTWSVKNDMVMIVNQSDAIRRPTIKAYYVSDLISKQEPIGGLQEIVMATMKSQQAPRFRRKGARPAADRRQVLGFQHTLFVAGTEEDHRRVDRLLGQLRKK